MKKMIFILALFIVSLSVSCQTGTGWKQVTTKQNFVTNINVSGPWSIGGITITPTASKFNFLSNVTSDLQSQLNGKQSILVSGVNIKTINSVSVVGAGNIVIGSGGSMVYPGAGIAVSNASGWVTSVTDNSTNWNTAYSDRLKWDGGATGLTAATARTSLGANDIGSALFTMTNPSAITFIRLNANNSVSTLSAANFKTSLSLTSADVGLTNVTNESKATMFANPVFTGVQKVSTTDTLSLKSYVRSYFAGHAGGSSSTAIARIDSIVRVLKDSTVLDVVAQMKHPTTRPLTSSGTLQLEDDGNYITMTSSSATTLTIPLHTSVGFVVGTGITVINKGTGTLTLVITSGISADYPALGIPQHGWAFLFNDGLNSWDITGKLQ